MKLDAQSTDRFVFGVGTSAFQIEGGATSKDRVANIWDEFCEIPGAVTNGDDGKVACDHYHLWENDMALLQELGVDSYRFSVSWGRVINNFNGDVNETGLAFYRGIIDRLNRLGIKPCLTLYHWDLPLFLEQRGGWLNRETAARFVHYADVVSRALGDDVAIYTTFNEPWCSSLLSYLHGVHAPGKTDRRLALQVAHHLLLAHGMAMPTLRKNAPKAEHGIVLNLTPYYPMNENPEDMKVSNFASDENNHWFMEPLLEGTYPQSIIDRYPDCIPSITPEDMAIISTPLDYLGINYYTRQCVKASATAGLFDYESEVPEQARKTAMGWEIFPQGLTDLLVAINERYSLPKLYITENGMASDDQYHQSLVEDEERVEYLRTHLSAVFDACAQGIDIRGYFAWSLLDNFEWAEGYSKRFGLYYVDYSTQARIPKLSAHFYRDFIQRYKKQKPTLTHSNIR